MVDSMKVELEFGALAMDTIITLTEAMVVMEAIVAMEATDRSMLSVNVWLAHMVVGVPNHLTYTQHQQRASTRTKGSTAHTALVACSAPTSAGTTRRTHVMY